MQQEPSSLMKTLFPSTASGGGYVVNPTIDLLTMIDRALGHASSLGKNKISDPQSYMNKPIATSIINTLGVDPQGVIAGNIETGAQLVSPTLPLSLAKKGMTTLGKKILASQQANEALKLLRTADQFNNADEFYRVINGVEAYDDLVNSGVVRTNYLTKPIPLKPDGRPQMTLTHRPTKWPSFAKGKAEVDRYAKGDDSYVLVTSDKSMSPSREARHGLGHTQFPYIGKEPQVTLSGDVVSAFKRDGDKFSLVYDKGNVIQQPVRMDIPSTVDDVPYVLPTLRVVAREKEKQDNRKKAIEKLLKEGK